MKIGLMYGLTADSSQDSLDNVVKYAKEAEATGFSSLWMPNIFSWDAITALSLVGRETSRIELGTAVVPTYPRHPMAIAQQALTASAACGGRFTLGIGLSHKVVIEDMMGLSYAKPARHMKEYLDVLTPLLRGEAVDHQGEVYQVKGRMEMALAPEPQLLVAALGERMLDHAGRMSNGTITWMTGLKTLADHIVPSIGKAAEAAGHPGPRVVAGLPIALTQDVAAGREAMGKLYSMYGYLPSYRAMLDREGVEGPGDVALVGDEAALRAELARFRDAGVTDFDAAVTPIGDGSVERTMEFLATEL